MKKVLVVGYGEVGSAHARDLSKVPSYQVRATDLDRGKIPEEMRAEKDFAPDVLLVAIRHQDEFVRKVKEIIEATKPQLINVLSTVPPGTCAAISPAVTHSTTRGLHPNLDEGILNITKHVGGGRADAVARFFSVAGINCHTHGLAKTTEAAHILNNAAYGINLMFADEMQKMCRKWGVDYFDAVMVYTATNNDGFEALDQKTKRRMILTPPNGRLGGHCVSQSAGLVPEGERTPMLDMLAKYNG